MVAMTVVAGGDARRDIGPAQGHGLAVIRVAIVSQPVLVALATAFIADGLEIIPFRIHDIVRGVTICADRPTRIALRQQLSVDALIVSVFHAEMAFAAGLGDVGVIDRRITIHGAFDVVNAMAIVT